MSLSRLVRISLGRIIGESDEIRMCAYVCVCVCVCVREREREGESILRLHSQPPPQAIGSSFSKDLWPFDDQWTIPTECAVEKLLE